MSQMEDTRRSLPREKCWRKCDVPLTLSPTRAAVHLAVTLPRDRHLYVAGLGGVHPETVSSKKVCPKVSSDSVGGPAENTSADDGRLCKITQRNVKQQEQGRIQGRI